VWTERGGSASPSPPSVLWAKANRLCPVVPFFLGIPHVPVASGWAYF
jgi:hypothetical protein